MIPRRFTPSEHTTSRYFTARVTLVRLDSRLLACEFHILYFEMSLYHSIIMLTGAEYKILKL